MRCFFLLTLLIFITGCSGKSEFSAEGWNDVQDTNGSQADEDAGVDEEDDDTGDTFPDEIPDDASDEAVGNDDNADYDDEGQDTTLDEDVPEEPCAIEGLEGVWVQRNILVTNSKSPVGTTTESKTTTYNRIEMACSGPFVRFTGKVCEIDMENNSIVKITAPRQLIDNLDPIDRAVEINDCEGEKCLHQLLTAETRGVKLNDPLNDPLPRDGTNYDQDLDGNPGVTVIASGFIQGELFFIQRIKSEFTVKWTGGSIVSGALWFEDSQFTLGSDPYGTGLEKQRDPIVALLDKSNTALKKIDPSMTCVEIADQRKSLFD